MASASFVPRKRQERGERRILDIVAAASELFAAHGFDGTTMNGIAQRAGLSIGSLYQYFPDKNAIVDAVAKAYTDEWIAKSRALIPLAEQQLPFEEFGYRSLRMLVEFHRRHAAVAAFLAADPERAQSIRDLQTKIDFGVQLVASYYPDAVHEEVTRAVDVAALIVRNVAHQIADEPKAAAREWYAREVAASLVAYFARRLGPPREPRSAPRRASTPTRRAKRA